MPRSLNTDRKIILIAHNIRSTHNVGSLFRTAEGLGVNELILSGYTPYPKLNNDDRLSHIANKLDKQIDKTALGAQNSLAWSHVDRLDSKISELKLAGYEVVAVEQHKDSLKINNFNPKDKIAILVGNEVTGLEEDELRLCEVILEIPMLGKKESFNVVQAAAMSLFYLRLTK